MIVKASNIPLPLVQVDTDRRIRSSPQCSGPADSSLVDGIRARTQEASVSRLSDWDNLNPGAT